MRTVISLGIHTETGRPMVTIHKQRVCSCQGYEHDRSCLYHPKQATRERDSYERQVIAAERSAAPRMAGEVRAEIRGQLLALRSEALKFRRLAEQATEQADNLERMAGL